MSERQRTEDSQKVDRAIERLLAEDVPAAMDLLVEVLRNAPAVCDHVTEADDGLQIRFWSQAEFIYYCTTLEPQVSIVWVPNAYARAFYYLGFLWVKLGRPQTAIEALDRGLGLETHPLLLCEKAKAVSSLGRHEEALGLYRAAAALPPDLLLMYGGVALRGQGVQLIDLGDLDGAEAVFERSLELDPQSEVAHNELRYIADLRAGVQHSGGIETVSTTFSSAITCARCGRDLEKGKVHTEGSQVRYLCERCLEADADG